MKNEKEKIVAVKAALIAGIDDLDNDNSVKWDAYNFLAECNLDESFFDPAYNIEATIYLSQGAWDFFKDCIRGFHISETDLVLNELNGFTAELAKLAKSGNAGSEWVGTKEVKPLKTELNLHSFGFDVFTVFYRMKSGRLEIIQFVDDDSLANADEYLKLKRLAENETIGGQPAKVSKPVLKKKKSLFGKLFGG